MSPSPSNGHVTPGIRGRLLGGVRASGDWESAINFSRSYTILVPGVGVRM